MKRLTRALVLSLAGISLTLSSCKMTKNLDEMHDATIAMPDKMDGMKKTTEDMKKTTEDMKKTTEDMKKTTCKMYRSLRQGNSKASRDQDIQDIKSAPTLPGKLAEAAEYMQGFEYQVWSPDCEAEISRDEALEQFAKELLAKMQGFVYDRDNVHPANITAKLFHSDEMDALFALAATLHYTNALQANLLQGSTYPVLRPFDVLVNGLEIDKELNEGTRDQSDVPSYVEPISKYSKDAIYLLRARQNFLMAYAYAVADSDDAANTPGTTKEMRRVIGSTWFNSSWKPNLDVRTAQEINERITAALNLSVETNAALVRLGIDPMVDKTFAKIWEHADFSKYDVPTLLKSAKPNDRILGKAIQDLLTARDQVVAAWKKSSSK